MMRRKNWILRMSTSALVAEKVWNDIESTHSVSDEQLSMSVPFLFFLISNFWSCFYYNSSFLSRLHFLFGKNLERAMRIVDQRGVKRMLGHPSGRSIFQVVGESKRKEKYLCFPQHYCSCYSFFYDIVNRGEQLCCKHQLAARLASSLGTCIDVKMSDHDLALMLSHL
ncbi:hypothetical protein H5410_057205 [Solanum commersonii]|uniref:SWIM-type domain-containing protein n=1 Tax=Solanum commersonii TaxID=4109 RepID=A0A9J5WPF2_SOLCO|nr:hypothetical protein H5410_057205 [Solanum commersonii]